jgi:hypothetical protein
MDKNWREMEESFQVDVRGKYETLGAVKDELTSCEGGWR